MENEKSIVAGATTDNLPVSAGADAAHGVSGETRRVSFAVEISAEERLIEPRRNIDVDVPIALLEEAIEIGAIKVMHDGVVLLTETRSMSFVWRGLSRADILDPFAALKKAIAAKKAEIARDARERQQYEERKAREKAYKDKFVLPDGVCIDSVIGDCEGVRIYVDGAYVDTIVTPETITQVVETFRAEQARREAERERTKREAEELAERLEKEKMEWIAGHGSDRLKALIAAGYNGNKLYRQERDAFALKGLEYVVDTRDAADEIRDSPSEDALIVEKQLKNAGFDDVKIVWLKENPRHTDIDDFEPREAVRVFPSWRNGAVYIFP